MSILYKITINIVFLPMCLVFCIAKIHILKTTYIPWQMEISKTFYSFSSKTFILLALGNVCVYMFLI